MSKKLCKQEKTLQINDLQGFVYNSDAIRRQNGYPDKKLLVEPASE